MRAYSADLRERVLADCDAGTPTAEVASRYRASASWGRRLEQRRREAAPRAQKYGRTPKWAGHAEAIRAPAREAPGAPWRSTAAGSAWPWAWGSRPSGGHPTPRV